MNLKKPNKKSINELYGIIQGINADEVINKEEIVFLQEWLAHNKNYENNDLLGEIYKFLEKILEDNIISNEEKEQLLEKCKMIEKTFNNCQERYNNLLGIIQGISCDKKINETELEHLKMWLGNNSFLRGNLIFDKIYLTINQVLEDKIISSEEEKELLELFDTIIISKKENMVINYVGTLIKQSKNIGNFIISIYENEKLTKKIHLNAKAELLKALNQSTSINLLNTEIIFISLCLIALEKYDGNFYDYVADEYSELYEKYTRQRIDGTIRSIIRKYLKDEENTTRQINYVLENTLVPLKFLANYFDFVFDIYKINFQFLLDDNKIDEDIEFVFNGMKSIFKGDNDDVSIEVTNKTYKLIKTTQNLIYNKESSVELKNLTKNILKIIDDYYWNNVSNLTDNYYSKGLNNWLIKNNKEVSDIKNTLKENKETLRSKWLPSFRLIGNDVFLHIPEHKIKDDYDYSDIKILIYENNKIIEEITDFKIFSILGGYKIEVPDIKIDRPLDNIKYKINANGEIIYDSNELLKNDFILFNEKGVSISQNRSYEGNLYIVFKNNIYENVTVLYKTDNYSIGSIYVKNDTILKINENYITFNKDIMSGIVGTIYNDTFVNYKDIDVKVYKSISQIVFETENLLSEIGIKINNKRYRLEEFKYTNKFEKGKNIIFLDYAPTDDGYYEIYFFNIFTGKNLKSGKYEFFIDTKLNFEVEKLDKNNYSINVESKLISNKKEILLNISDYSNFKITTDYGMANYKLPLNIPMYKIDDGNWKSVEDYIWIEDITINSILYIQGIEVEELLIVNDRSEPLIKLKAFIKDKIYKIPIGTLRTYIDTTEKVNIFLMYKSNIKQFIECYMKCIINKNESLISFDSENEELLIKLKIFGKGKFKLMILNERDNILYEKEFETNAYITKIKNVVSNKLYKIKVFKIATGFSMEGDIELYSKEEKFYSFKWLENKNLKIESVDFDVFNKYTDELIRKKLYLHRTYFHIEKYLENKKFIANVYEWKGYENYLNNINPIEIELSSEIESNCIEVAASKDGDGLLIDFSNKSILNSIDDLNASDIYSCKIRLNNI